MEDCLEKILTRRSIRSFTDREINKNDIETILRAAMAAPSAGNQQPWHFVVVDDRPILEAVIKVHPYSKMLLSAPIGILVCADLTLEKHKGCWVQDCSAATQNLLLAAHAIGLGAVWLGVHPVKDRVDGFREIFKLPENVIPLSMVAIGYPKEKPGAVNRFNKDRIHQNSW